MLLPNVQKRKFRLFFKEPNGTYIPVQDRFAILFENEAGSWQIYFPDSQRFVANPSPTFLLSEETVLKDRNNTPICTGDICEYEIKNEFGSWHKVRGVCKFNAIGGRYMLVSETNNIPQQIGVTNESTHPIIIGNVYMNPELLDDGKRV